MLTGQGKGSPQKTNQEVSMGWMVPLECGRMTWGARAERNTVLPQETRLRREEG